MAIPETSPSGEEPPEAMRPEATHPARNPPETRPSEAKAVRQAGPSGEGNAPREPPARSTAAVGASLATVNLVAGVLSGVALYGAVAVAVLRARPAHLTRHGPGQPCCRDRDLLLHHHIDTPYAGP